IEPFVEEGMALFEARPDVNLTVLPDTEPGAIREAIVDAHGVTVRLARLTEEMLEQAPNLEIVSRHGVGCDSVPVDYLTGRGVPVAITSGANSNSVAEHTLMMMLSLARGAADYDQSTRRAVWRDPALPQTIELADRTILIIGFGRIGRLVAALCRAFGMRVLLCDIALDAERAERLGCERADDYRAALGEADFVTLHVPLADDTRNMIGADEITRMRDGAYLINCARGGIVDEIALVEALKSGKLAGAGLDVFEQEPVQPDHPLFALSNVILSPHSSAMTEEGMRRMGLMTAGNVLDHFDGKLRPDCVFNPEVFDVLQAKAS
ncbi:MAG: hydroxyacid dehydrogenase, partial [Methyloligellaceae bacterium]